jgi:hypothetical protein
MYIVSLSKISIKTNFNQTTRVEIRLIGSYTSLYWRSGISHTSDIHWKVKWSRIEKYEKKVWNLLLLDEGQCKHWRLTSTSTRVVLTIIKPKGDSRRRRNMCLISSTIYNFISASVSIDMGLSALLWPGPILLTRQPWPYVIHHLHFMNIYRKLNEVE